MPRKKVAPIYCVGCKHNNLATRFVLYWNPLSMRDSPIIAIKQCCDSCFDTVLREVGRDNLVRVLFREDVVKIGER